MSNNIKILAMVILSFMFMQKSFTGVFSGLGFGGKKNHFDIQKNALQKLKSKDEALYKKVEELMKSLGNNGARAFSGNIFNKCFNRSPQEELNYIVERENEFSKWNRTVNEARMFIVDNLSNRHKDYADKLYSINSNLMDKVSFICAKGLKDKDISSLEKSQKDLLTQISKIEGSLKKASVKESIATLLILQYLSRSLEGHFSTVLKQLKKL